MDLKMLGVTSRKERTAVYAGHSRGHHYDHVPRLDDMCIRVLIANIDAISFLGDVPFYIMEPVLSKCSSTQLKRIEDMNPMLIEDSDKLWKFHCQREFKEQKPGPDETWRHLYLRSTKEREKRLKRITKKLKKKAVEEKQNVKETKKIDAFASAGLKSNGRVAITVKSPVGTVSHSAASMKATAAQSRKQPSSMTPSSKSKPKVAPLMLKCAKMAKQRFRR